MRAEKRNNPIKKIVLGLCILLVIAGVSYGGYVFLNRNPYDNYDTYNKETKQIGTMQHSSETEEERYHLSFYYPKLDVKVPDDAIEMYKKEHLKSDRKESGMVYVNIDYDIEEIYDTYITIAFHKTIKDSNEKVLEKETTHLNYDKKKDGMIEVQDVLRHNYISLLKILGEQEGIDASLIKTSNLTDFTIGKEAVTFYIEDKKVSVNYDRHKSNIALTNKNIPSFYMKDPILPKTMKVDPKKKMIAITFDDGPHGQNTEIIMSEFEKYGGRATFFMLGQNASVYPDIIKDMYQRGFELGNHSWDHSMRIAASLTNFMSKEEVSQELYKTQDSIFKASGRDAKYFRPPYGAINKNVREVSTMDFALWDIDTLDWQNRNPDKINEIIQNEVKDGSIILLHDIHNPSMEAVKKFLPILNEKGYQFVPLSTLMEYKGEQIQNEGSVIPSIHHK